MSYSYDETSLEGSSTPVASASTEEESSVYNGQVQVVDEDDLPEPTCMERCVQYENPKPLKHRSLFLFTTTNYVRMAVHRVVGHWIFDTVIMLFIVINCVFLAMETPDLEERDPDLKRLMNNMEILFFIVFALEAGLKIFAYGFCLESGSYLRSKWNWLDFIVVLLGALAFVPQAGNYSAIRALRVLRALKSLKTVPGLRTLVETLLKSVPPMGNVLLLTVFFISLFAILGMSLFMGALRKRCVIPLADGSFLLSSTGALCASADDCMYDPLPEAAPVDAPYLCAPEGPNPAHGYIGFDHFALAFLSLMQVFTLDSWDTDVMDPIIQSTSNWAVLYFVVAVMVGSFFVINLMLAVVADSYDKSSSGAQQTTKRQAVYHQITVTSPTFDFGCEGYKVNETCAQCPVDVMLRRPFGLMHAKDENTYTVNYETSAATATANLDYKETRGTLTFGPNDIRHKIFIEIIDDDHAEDDEYFWVSLSAPSGGAVLGEQKRCTVTIVDDDKPGVFSFENRRVNSHLRADEIDIVVVRTDGLDGTASVHFSTEDKTALSGVDYEPVRTRLEFTHGERKKAVTVPLMKERNWKKVAAFGVRLKNPSYGASVGLGRTTAVIRGEAPPVYQRVCHDVVDSPKFMVFIIIMIALNTVALCLEYPGMSSEQARTLEWLNVAFTLVFFVEMVLKLVGLNFYVEYLVDRFNLFDAAIVFFSILEIVLRQFDVGQKFQLISVLRVFRLLRIFKLVREWKSLQKVLLTVIKSITLVSYLSVIVAIYLIIFALMGMQLFSGKFDHPDLVPKPRFNYDTFFWALMSIFRILIGQWSEGMRNAMVATNEGAALFYVGVMIMGIFLVLNLFVAILLQNFGGDDFQPPTIKSCTPVNGAVHVDPRSPVEVTFSEAMNPGTVEAALAVTYKDDGQEVEGALNAFKWGPGQLSVKFFPLHELLPSSSIVVTVSTDAKDLSGDPMREPFRSEFVTMGTGEYSMDFTTSKDDEDDPYADLADRSFYIFAVSNPFRRACFRVVNHAAFDYFILGVVLVSAIVLALDHPFLPEDSDTARAVFVINYIIASIFVIEMIMKMIAWGVCMHPGSYCRDPWNWLDFSICVVSFLQFSPLHTFRTLRAFKPLRSIKHNEGMRAVLNALLSSIPSILNVVVVCALFYLTFAILGVQGFGKKFLYCTDPTITTEADCLEAMRVAIASNLTAADVPAWRNTTFNFDDVLQAFISLMKIATFDDWHVLFFSGIDAVGIGFSPRRDYSRENAIFFVLFIIVGSFFALNLFVGVVIDQFNSLRKKNIGFSLLSEKQLEYRQIMMATRLFKPRLVIPRDESGWRMYLHDVVMTTQFEIFILVVIFLNTVTLAMAFHAAPGYYVDLLEALNFLWTAIFFVEMVLKLLVMKNLYFHDTWNVFDFALVWLSIVTILLSFIIPGAEKLSLLRVLRVFRVIRVIKIAKRAKGLRMLMMTLVYAAPSLLNVGTLLFIVFFVYAIFGMNLFGRVKVTDTGVTEHINFHTFGNAITLLFKLSSGPGWSAIMASCSVRPPSCSLEEGDCGSPVPAYIFFLSFIVVGYLVMINLYIAVILESFAQAQHEQNMTVGPELLDEFRRVWGEHDPEANYSVPISTIPDILARVPVPLGYKSTIVATSPETLNEIIYSPDVGPRIPVVDGKKVFFFDLLLALLRNAMGDVALPEDMDAELQATVLRSMPKRVQELQDERKEFALRKATSGMLFVSSDSDVPASSADLSSKDEGSGGTAEASTDAMSSAEAAELLSDFVLSEETMPASTDDVLSSQSLPSSGASDTTLGPAEASLAANGGNDANT